MVFPTTIKWVLLVPELSSHVSLEALTKPKEALSRKRRWRYSHPHNYTDFASLNLRIYNVFPTFHADTPDEKRFVQGTCVPVLTCEGKCSCWRAKPAHFVGHLQSVRQNPGYPSKLG